jgi:type I restriction enzyme R subunit
MVQESRQYRGGYRFVDQLENARAMRKQQTVAEELLWNLLRRRQLDGFKFRRQHQFGKYVADFYCHEAKLVIECEGRVHDSNEQWNHDQNRDAYMISQGLRVLRFTNEEIVSRTEEVLKRILTFLPSGE